LYCALYDAVAAAAARRKAMAGDMHPSTNVWPTAPPSHAAPPPERRRARREPGPQTARGSVSDRVREVRGYYRRIAPYLDLELADRGDLGFWEWTASEPAGCRVLELGAGTGRATLFLARAAARVFACDLSPELVAIARERLGGLENVSLFVADMRRLCLAARFDLVVAVDDPFAHLLLGGERDRALRAAAAHLAPGGRLVLDAAWFSPHRRELASRPEGLVTERFRGGGAGQLRVREEVRCDTGRICHSRIEYRRAGAPPVAATFRSRLWSLAEIGRRCHAAGLEVVSLWGGYDRRPFQRLSSSRLIVEARPRLDRQKRVR
jgi:SAM-dependent methyltransferase